MSTSILLRTIGGADDKRIVLANSSIARALTFGTDWTALRIGARLSMTSLGVNLTSTPRFNFGICSGTTNIMGDATTTHWVGTRSISSTWTYVNSGGITRYTPIAYRPAKKVNTTITEGGSTFGHNVYHVAEAITGGRTMFSIDITKGSPNFSFREFAYIGGGGVGYDLGFDEFLANMELATPAITGHSFAASLTLAVSEADGSLDTLNVNWDRSTPQFEISDIAVARLS